MPYLYIASFCVVSGFLVNWRLRKGWDASGMPVEARKNNNGHTALLTFFAFLAISFGYSLLSNQWEKRQDNLRLAKLAADQKSQQAAQRERLVASRGEILSRVIALRSQGKYFEARDEAGRYAEFNDQEFLALQIALVPQVHVQELEQSLELTPENLTEPRASIYAELASLVPSNKSYAERSKFYSRRSKLEQAKTEKTVADEQRQQEKTAIAQQKNQGVSIGMSSQAVIRSSWGKPTSVNRTITAQGTREQWVYGGRNYLYFQDGVLTSIQN